VAAIAAVVVVAGEAVCGELLEVATRADGVPIEKVARFGCEAAVVAAAGMSESYRWRASATASRTLRI